MKKDLHAPALQRLKGCVHTLVPSLCQNIATLPALIKLSRVRGRGWKPLVCNLSPLCQQSRQAGQAEIGSKYIENCQVQYLRD